MREKLLELWCETLEIDVQDWQEIEKNGKIEIDSLMIIKFIVSVEDEFDVELDDSTLLLGTENILDKVYCELLKTRNNYENCD